MMAPCATRVNIYIMAGEGIGMTRRTKRLIGLAGGIVAAALLWSLSGSAWGRSGSFPVVRKALQTAAGLPGAGEGTYRLFLNAPPSDMRMAEVMVSSDIFHAVQEGDTLAIRIRILPPVGIEAIDYESQRPGAAAVRWSEGYPFLFAGIGAAGLAAGLVVTGLAGLAASLLKLSTPPDA